jgi:hypothetical protein
MTKLEYAWWCFVLAAVLGGTWGGLIYWFHEGAGLSIGLSLFFFCYVILVNTYDIEEEDLPQQNRRFNDF